MGARLSLINGAGPGATNITFFPQTDMFAVDAAMRPRLEVRTAANVTTNTYVWPARFVLDNWYQVEIYGSGASMRCRVTDLVSSVTNDVVVATYAPFNVNNLSFGAEAYTMSCPGANYADIYVSSVSPISQE